MTIITKPVRLTPDDVKKLSDTGKPAYQRHIGKIWIGILTVVVIALLPNSDLQAVLTLTQGFVVITLILFALRKFKEWADNYALRTSGAFERSIIYVIDSEHVARQVDKGKSSKTHWSEYRRLVVTDESYLLYQRRMIDWIPADAFKSQEDIDAFEKIIFALDVPMKFYD
ncbi:MAG: YcxB family protein [Anaerolineae bacterium]|nr:YcxB family protein [Anaerolineae bacterium]